MILYEFYLHFFVNQCCNNFYFTENKNYYNTTNGPVTFTLKSSCNVSSGRTDYISGAQGKANLVANITVWNGNITINSFSLSSYCWAQNDENGASTSNTAYTSNYEVTK